MSDTSLVAKIILRLQDDASRGLDNARQHVNGVATLSPKATIVEAV